MKMNEKKGLELVMTKKIALIISCIILIGLVCLLNWLFSPSSKEVLYNFELMNSSYKYPFWNITLKSYNDGLITVTACRLQYRDQMLDYHRLGAITLDKGDSMTLHFILDIHIASGEPFILWLYFSDKTFMRMNLTLPEE